MTPIDLRAAPPRSPYAELADMVLLARTVDKARALLPGGDAGSYWITPGISSWLLGKLGFDEAAFIALVGDAPNEAAVAAAVCARVDAPRRARLSDAIRSLTVGHLTGEMAELFPRIYGPCGSDERVLDVILRDDVTPYPTAVRQQG